MKTVRRDTVTGSFKSTEIGRLNRKIEQSVSGVFKGERGATSEAIGFAKKREVFLTSKRNTKKIPA